MASTGIMRKKDSLDILRREKEEKCGIKLRNKMKKKHPILVWKISGRPVIVEVRVISILMTASSIYTAFQMSSLLVQILKKSTYPGFQVWKYTFYPKSSKSADVHFHKIPEDIVESLKDFCFDVTGCYLPDDFLGDPIDESHWFMEKLPFNDARNEINRRRKMRQPVLETFTMALWQALRTLRNYHYDISSRQLLNCTSRGDCTAHLKWEHLKNFREKCRNEGIDQDEYTEQQLQDYAMIAGSSALRNSSSLLNGSRVQQ